MLLLRLEPSNTQSNTCICFAIEHACIEDILYHKEKTDIQKGLGEISNFALEEALQECRDVPMGGHTPPALSNL